MIFFATSIYLTSIVRQHILDNSYCQEILHRWCLKKHLSVVRFDVPTASASIAENNARNQYLIQVSAKDDDIGANGAVSYRFLEPYANDFFTVNQRTGVVTARAPLDREQTPVLRFSILAVDKGETPKTGSIGYCVKPKI